MRQRSSTVTIHKVHNYLVGAPIARGTFGTIRSGVNRLTEEDVAIKLLSNKKLRSFEDGDFIMFNEKKLAPLLNHPNIVKIKEVIECSGQAFVVMEKYTKNLLQFINTHKVPFTDKIRIIDQILSAVEYIHSLGICHRDIKLENILLDDEENAHLCDFGFASFCDLPAKGYFGSEGYAAPEIFHNLPYDGRKVDMWSLGVLIFSILAERKPFSSKGNIKDINYTGIPPSLVPYISSCLNVDPAMRCTASDIRHSAVFECLKERHENPKINLIEPISQIDYMATTLVRSIFGKYDTSNLTNYGANRYKTVYYLSFKERSHRVKSDISFSLPSDISSFCPHSVELHFSKDPLELINESANYYLRKGCCVSLSHNEEGITLNIVKNKAECDEKLSIEFSSQKPGCCDISYTEDSANDSDLADYFQGFSI